MVRLFLHSKYILIGTFMSNPSIKVYDAMMGSGKTHRIINQIKDSKPEDKFLFITPILTECHRIAGTSYEEDDPYLRPTMVGSEDGSIAYYYEEDAPLKDKLFKHPYFGSHGGKKESLPQLFRNKDNIVSTHRLFLNLTPESLKYASDYTLIIDEMLTVYEEYKEYSREELEAMMKNNWVSIDKEDGVTLKFHRDAYAANREDGSDVVKDTYYETFATLCDLKQLMLIDGKLIAWELSIDTLKSFKEIWIASYLFENSTMSAYLKTHGLDYELIKFGKKPSEIKQLINIYEPTKGKGINEIGLRLNSLTVSDYKKNSKTLKAQLSKNLDNYFRNYSKAKKSDRLWTTFKFAKASIETRYGDEWLALSTKATNNYKHIHNVAYLINLYPNPMLIKASALKGFSSSQDIFALSEMIQFIWRSAIREGEPINLYVPSLRMRNLLKSWLDDQYL